MTKSPKFQVYLFEYFHEGSWWSVKIPATSMDDAQARIDKMPLAKPVGELVAEVPARVGLLARVACSVRNLFSARQAA
jgi:hypothetical protein